MDSNIGVIRDKEGIYSGLVHCKTSNRQLAVCFSQEGKLIVRISVVKDLVTTETGTSVILASSDDPPDETAIPIENIRSIYPISAFIK